MRVICEWLFSKRLDDMAGIPGFALRMTRIAYLTVVEFRRNLCFQRAAALSFASIISLIPLAVLFFSFAGLLGGGDRIIEFVREKVFPQLAPDFQDQLSNWLDEYISKEAFSGGRAGVVNVAAVISLIFASLGVMVTAEHNLNRSWGTSAKRGYLQKLATFWIILTVSPLFIAMSMAVGELLVPEGGWIDRLTEDSWFGQAIYSQLVPFVVGFIAFATIYTMLPATRVKVKSGIAGAILATILWEVSKQSFFVYVQRASTVTSFYPKLAALPLFLIWVYVNWMIMLLGAQFSFVHQNLETFLRRREEPVPIHRRFSTVCLGLTLLGRCLDSFLHGKEPPTVEGLSGELGIDVSHMDRAARLLMDHRFLVEDASNVGTFVLARSPSKIELRSIAELLASADFPLEVGEHEVLEINSEVGGQEVESLLTSAWESFISAFGTRTLAGPDAKGR